MAELVVGRQTFQTDQQLVARDRFEIRRENLAVHLVFQTAEQRAAPGVDQHLGIHQHLEVSVLILRVVPHQMGKGLPLDKLGADRPHPLMARNLEDLRDVQPDLLHTRLVQGFV